jgi:hypothetical protein
MAIVYPGDGEDALLKDMLGVTTPDDLTVKLYTNDYTPVAGSTAASFTEMSGQGYAEKTLAIESWVPFSVDPVGEVLSAGWATTPHWEFSDGGPTTVYGYYVVGADDVIRWAARFATPFVVRAEGGSLSFLAPLVTSADMFDGSTYLVASPAYALGLYPPGDLVLGLFTNDLDPPMMSDPTEYVEMTGMGYAAKTLTMANWVVAQDAGTSKAIYPQQSWTFTAGGPTTIYGYCIVSLLDEPVVFWAQRFETPFVANEDDVLEITPQFWLPLGP